MFLDSELTISGGGAFGQDLSTAFNVGTTALRNVVTYGPLGCVNNPAPWNNPAGWDWGRVPEWLYLLFITQPTSGGGATLDAQLVTSASTALVSPTLMVDLTNGPQPLSKLPAGTAFKVTLPRNGVYNAVSNPGGWQQFMGINFIVANAALNGGIALAFMSLEPQDALIQAAGFTIQ
jgi:hypothetical protein